MRRGPPGRDDARRRRSTPGSRPRCGRSPRLAGRSETAELRAFYPTDVLTTARDIIFLWVARMVMMGIEFTGELPFTDVRSTRSSRRRDGRRMSKSLGTGDRPARAGSASYGADGLRFGLLAMSSSQDVRYSAETVKQGRDLANKLWNASRLILLRVDDVPAGRAETVEDRWIVSRLERPTARDRPAPSRVLMSRAALDLYDFVLERGLRLVPRAGQAAPVRRGRRRAAPRRRCSTCSSGR